MSDNPHGTKSGNPGQQLCDQVIDARIATLRNRATILERDGVFPLMAKGELSEVAPRELIRLNLASKGYLLGLGDSWFDYFAVDVFQSLLNDLGYDGTPVAEAGTSLKTIADGAAQLKLLSRELEKTVGGQTPEAILLSGGGNDLVDFGLENLLNVFGSGLPPLIESEVAKLIDQQMAQSFGTILDCITALCRRWLNKTIPILIHGYAYPIPDGRYLIFPRRGPWLEPCFLNRGYDKLDLGPRTAVMKTLIDRLNSMQLRISAQPGREHVRHVDVRTTLAAADYTKMWINELHPTSQGFAAVAGKFDGVLKTLPALKAIP
jgi:hypothetical protein